MNSVQQSPDRGADNLPACQENCRSFWNPKVRRRVHKIPLLVIQRQLNPVHPILVHEEQFIHLLSPVFYEWSLFLTFLNQPLSTMRTTFPPIPFFLIWWHILLVSSIDYKVPCYVVFSSPLLLCPRWAQISSSIPASRTPWAQVLPSLPKTQLYTPTKQQNNNNELLCIILT